MDPKESVTGRAMVRSRLKRTDSEGDRWATERPTWHRPRVLYLWCTDLGKN